MDCLQRRLRETRLPGRPITQKKSIPLYRQHQYFVCHRPISPYSDPELLTVNTNGRIVLDTKINVFLDTETKVTGSREVTSQKLVLLDLETTLKNFLSLGATDGDVDRDLFVTTDTEGTDGITGFGVDGSL